MNQFSYIRNAWYVAGFSNDFEVDVPYGQKIVGRPVLLWRGRDKRISAFDNRCVHKRMPLSEGRILENGVLECAYHGLCYDSGGQCVTIPSQPDSAIPPQANLKPYPVIEQDGIVWVWPGDLGKQDESQPPRMPEVVDDKWESIVLGPMQVPANYLLLIENLLDISHFYPLHDGNIGDVANSRIPVELVEGEEDGNRFVKTIRNVQNYQQPPFLVDWFSYDVVDREHTHCMVSPALTRVEMRVAPPGQLGTEVDRGYILFHTHTPTDATNHVWRLCINCKADHMSKGDPNVSAAKRVAEMFPVIIEEDLWALEKQQQMFEYPDEGYSEVYLKPDKALRRVRQFFAAAQRKEAQRDPPKSKAASIAA